MEWCKFDDSQLPIVIVTFNRNIKNMSDINEFLNKWSKYVKDKETNYKLIIDTKNLFFYNVLYIRKIKSFISNVKKLQYNNLEWTLILISNNIIKKMFNLLLTFEKPISLVYLVNKSELTYNCLVEKITNQDLDLFNVFLP